MLIHYCIYTNNGFFFRYVTTDYWITHMVFNQTVYNNESRSHTYINININDDDNNNNSINIIIFDNNTHLNEQIAMRPWTLSINSVVFEWIVRYAFGGQIFIQINWRKKEKHSGEKRVKWETDRVALINIKRTQRKPLLSSTLVFTVALSLEYYDYDNNIMHIYIYQWSDNNVTKTILSTFVSAVLNIYESYIMDYSILIWLNDGKICQNNPAKCSQGTFFLLKEKFFTDVIWNSLKN